LLSAITARRQVEASSERASHLALSVLAALREGRGKMQPRQPSAQGPSSQPTSRHSNPASALSMAGMVPRPSPLAAEFVPSFGTAQQGQQLLQQQHGLQQQQHGLQHQQILEMRQIQQEQQLQPLHPQHQHEQQVQMQQRQQQQHQRHLHSQQHHRPQQQHHLHHGGSSRYRQYHVSRGGRYGAGSPQQQLLQLSGGGSDASGAGGASSASFGGARGSTGGGGYDIYAKSQIRENARLDMAMMLRSAASSAGVPDSVNQYYSLLPLELSPTPVLSTSTSMSIVYKAISSETGSPVALRRILGSAPAHSSQIVRAADTWKRISHPAIVSLREVFTSRAFTSGPAASSAPTNEIVFASDLCLRAETLHNVFLAADHQYHPLGEATMWAVATQLLAATAEVHASGLALRSALSPSCILVTGRNRVRINRIGISDAFDPEGVEHLPGVASLSSVGGSPAVTSSVSGAAATSAASSASAAGLDLANDGVRVVVLQREDLSALGGVLLLLAARSLAGQVRGGVLVSGPGVALEALQRSGLYSADLLQLFAVLVSATSPSSRTVVRDVLSMIGPRLAVEMGNVWTHADQLEGQLVKECDASRLFRLATLLGFVNERFDPQMGDTQWAETGDRYLLKLFRDYVFHRCDDAGRPVLDFALVVECLNRLDVGSPEQVLLSSRDGASLIIASYDDLRRCLMQAVDELRQRGIASAAMASAS
jgi:PAB-dependent poly(A)-specific ribonuclease subunit 3